MQDFIPISKPFLDKNEKEAVLRVIDSGILSSGSEILEFETNFAEYTRTKYAIAVCNGTFALILALIANDIKKDDEVILSPFSFIASATSILSIGAKPVFVDINPETYNIDENLIEQNITKNTRAIMPIHLFGLPCNMQKITDLAKKYNLKIIEDCAQAVGAKFNNIPVGSFGTGCFSLYSTKNITSGEGGIITTNDHKIYEKCLKLRNHGSVESYYHTELGYNYRITEMQAAIAKIQLNKLSVINSSRAQIANYYLAHIKNMILPTVPIGYTHGWNQFTLRAANLEERNDLLEYLQKQNIGARIYYPKPIHLQPYFTFLHKNTNFSLPNSVEASDTVISIPIYPSMTNQEFKRVSEVVNEYQ